MLPPNLLPVPVFNAMPGACLLLTPGAVIEAASDDYLAATLTAREQLVGRTIFDAFPENPATPENRATDHLRASLARVLATGQPHQMAPQHYDVPDPEQPGCFVERYWRCTNRPVLGADGQATHVLHFAVDITGQHQAEHSLLEAQAAEQAARADADEQRAALGRAFEQAPVSIAILRGPEFVVELANPSLGALWGRPVGPALGRPLFEALPDLAGQGLEELLAQALRTGEPLVFRERPTLLARDPAGPPALGYYNFTYQPLHDAQGQVTGIITVGLDVTEQVVARQQVQQLNQELEARVEERTRAALALQADLLAAAQEQADQRALLYQVFEQTPALVALLRAPGHRFEYVNAAYQVLFTGRQLVGRDAAEAAPELATQGFVALMDQVYRTGETFYGQEMPFTPRPAPGEASRARYFNFTYQAYREGGAVAGVSIFAYDVTEQVLARQEREAERQQLHHLFMEAPAPIVIFDGPDLVYQLVNPAYQRIFPGRTLLGKPLLEALPELAGLPLLQDLQHAYDTGETFVARELPLMLARHDGGPLEEIYWTFTYQARRTAHGEVDGVLVFAHEVTDQVQARRVVEESGQQAQDLAAELAASNQQLTRTNVDLDNFIYTASHDLKAPISNIEGLLYLLQEELPPAVAQDPEIAPTLTRMFEAVERFKRTIDHLTDVSKLQKEHDPAATLVNLAAVIEDVRQDLEPLLRTTGAKLVVDVPALPAIEFSEKNLRSIVYNLLSNAVKYRHPDRTPHVDVRAHVRPGHTVLEVHDNGLGLAPAHVPRLFTMFQRFHDHVEGTGIGLYMINRMVENAGGRIEVHSQLGAGTTFFVFLPHDGSAVRQPFPAYLPS